ncbi:MAG: tyrosine-type recombinase/integrase [Propionibacteriaceae bacterium]|nr:tyrosine-type recombinase/integrase [Propionibacteriaceae bacterium]
MGTIARALGPDPAAVTPEQITSWASQKTWARETRRSTYACLRSFFGWCSAAGGDPTSGLPSVKPADPRPRPTPDVVYRRALHAAAPRTAVILQLAAEGGLRRAEIARVHSLDLSGCWLTVHGKGDKTRTVPLPSALAATVAAADGWVFPAGAGGHLTPGHVGVLASRALPPGWTLHTLRHRFATAVYAATGDLLAVQTLLGHSSPATTRLYVAVDGARLMAAARLAWAT